MTAALSPGVRMLVRAPDWLGDLAMSEPALRAIESVVVGELGGALTLAGSPRLLDVFDDNLPGARRVDAADPKAWRGHDVALLFVNSFRSAWLAARAGIGRRIGFARDLRGPLLTDAIRPARELGGTPMTLGIAGRFPRYLPRPFGSTCIELAGALGIAVHDTRPRIAPGVHGLRAARERLAKFGIARGAAFALVNVGSRPNSAKGYPAESWARVVAELADAAAMPIVLACGPGEEAAAREVLAGAAAGRVHACFDPIADLRELVALAAAARVFVTADAGPRHVAVATGTPAVVIAGPTDPRHTADHTRSTRLIRVPVECGPCHREICPLNGSEHHACMRAVPPDRVVAAVLESLARSHNVAVIAGAGN